MIFLAAILISILIRFVFIAFNITYRPFIKFCCWIGWHWKIKTIGWDGASQHGVCTGCYKKGLMDSNGDFF